jgi:hypothetical protein
MISIAELTMGLNATAVTFQYLIIGFKMTSEAQYRIRYMNSTASREAARVVKSLPMLLQLNCLPPCPSYHLMNL